jgi:hypothetical protein
MKYIFDFLKNYAKIFIYNFTKGDVLKTKLTKSINLFFFVLFSIFMVISFSCKAEPDDFKGDDQTNIEDTDDKTTVDDEKDPTDSTNPTNPSNPANPSNPTFTPSAKSGVMLQGFNWSSAPRTASSHWGKWYKVMIKNADTIGDRFSYVWCPPPSKCDTASSEGYCPTELNVLNNCYGTESELKQMIQAISPAKAIADIVVNHRSGSTSWGDFTKTN